MPHQPVQPPPPKHQPHQPPHSGPIRNVGCEYFDGKGQMANAHVGPCASCGKQIWIETPMQPNTRYLCKTCFADAFKALANNLKGII